jgi:hypothetical protein
MNPGAETADLSGWTLDLQGGGGWSATFDDIAHSGTHSFQTSFGLDTRHQTVDLLAAGFTAEFLDAAPAIVFSDWVAARFDCGARYFVRYELLDANMQVITFFEHGTPDALITLPAGTPYFQEANTFTNYGPGVRFLNFIDGGQDSCFFAGNYGAHFDDALAAVVVPRACCLPGGVCQTLDLAACITASGTPQTPGAACSLILCPTSGNGACCCGSHCSITAAAACTGPNRRFVAASAACTPVSNTVPCCRGDYNKTGAPPSVQDIFDFLAGYFNGDACADTNDTGGVPTVQDIFDFLSAYFGGC